MTDESYELAVALEAKGAETTKRELGGVEEKFDDTAESVDESASNMEGFSKKYQGALQAIVSALAIATAGVLSRVPVLQSAAAGVSAVVDALAMRIDERLRPAIVPLNEKLYETADYLREVDGAAGDVLDALLLLGGAAVIATAGIGGLGALLPGLSAGGALTAVAGAVKTVAGTLFSLATGSLAAAAAFGFLLGLLGVGILAKTGVLQDIRQLGQAVGEALPASVRDGILTILSLFLGPLAVIGAAIAGFVTGFLEGGLSEGISRAVENAKEALGIFAGAWKRTLGRVKEKISDLIGKAYNLGRSLVKEFASGIKSKISDVADAASGVAAEARAHLPGSPADTGPLSDLDETGPALVETFADGMAGGVGRVRSAAVDVAGAADNGGDGGDTVRVSTSAPDILLDGRKIERRTGRVGRDDTARRGI
jgi:hypothetical protein